MATFKLLSFILSLSSLWLIALTQDSVPIINNYVTINMCDDGSACTKSISISDSPTATCTVNNDTTDAQQVNPCRPNSCLYGGSCITTDDQKDYRCVNCPYPMGGKTCSELTCHPNCLRVDDKIYFIFPNKDTSQHASHLKCKENNMTLAMIKDSIVHHQIRKQITMINIDNLDAELCYWIGLRKENGASPWKWFDGTELGAYDDWGNSHYSDYYCGQICRYKVYKFTRDICRGTDNWTYFSLCEKAYPFLKG